MNILNTIQEQLSPELVGHISKSVGESPEATQNALNLSLPALLGSAVAKASSSEGAGSLFNFLKDKAPQGGWPPSTSGLPGDLSDKSGLGSSLVNSLFGSKLGSVRDFIAKRSGIRTESASSLLDSGGHLLTGLLGGQIATQGLGPSSFGELLRSQLPHLQGLVPPELGSLFGLGSLLSAGKASVPSISYATSGAKESIKSMAGNVSAKSGILARTLVPVVILLAVIFGVSHYLHRSNMGGTSDDSFATGSSTTAGLAERLKTAIANGDNVPVSLEGVGFDSSGNLAPGSSGPLYVISGIMNHNPHLKATITAYGDTSNQAAAHANTLQTALAKTGISEDRIDVRPEVGNTNPKISFSK